MKRVRITVTGVVQGVGFRPFVYGLATRLGLTGLVGNDSAGVFIEIEGDAAALSEFERALVAEQPPLAHIEAITSTAQDATGATDFVIVASTTQAGAATLISPDLCICDDCLRELFDPNDRRYHYPFINCTNCGPRFTITRDIPYDRPLTTMARLRHVSSLPARVRRSVEPALSCTAECVPGLRAASEFGARSAERGVGNGERVGRGGGWGGAWPRWRMGRSLR